MLVPADQAWRFGYGNRLDLVDVPEYDGIDLTYPMRHSRAVDFFFDRSPEERPWIAALDAEGNGLVQASTERLRGRKLFVWGEAGGGRVAGVAVARSAGPGTPRSRPAGADPDGD